MNGWIKLHRNLVNWEWYDDANCLRLLIHLLVTVNYEAKQWRGITINAGTRVTSWEKLALELNLTINQVRTAMQKLEQSGEVTRQITNKYQAISLVKWGQMQAETPEQSQANHKQNNRQITTTKEIKNNKKEKKKETNKNKILLCSISDKKELSTKYERLTFSFYQLFKSNLLASGIKKTSVLDKADFESWLIHIKRMVEIDERTDEEIIAVYQFLKVSDFWGKNIQSTKKLREQFEKLYLECKTTKNQNDGNEHDYDEELFKELESEGLGNR